ncbi:DNA damage-repair/toleration protein DRT102 isoform X3 [Physcomitrium patens]|uniref:DNA damage-repair/toleration protein DRT102 isoform X3 n=1 Tax=Physcomitrium patens TaxID=3218 RepID=UPI000D15B7A4|nr:DNA damage-repair/toleration protein DRT102-like isoform X3 [Physcomitrium patens]|eukprot:XP_024377133.1 DNA damage-repair/toleration protein DRT102-like isoform X3 [Physcomitrella patens]
MADEAASEKPRRVVAGADAFGSELKDTLVQYLKEKDIEVVDLGVDKYYSVAVKVASELAKEKKLSSEGPLSRGLLVCGTGVGVSIFANKFAGVYAAPCNSVDEAMNARSINNTNVLTIGAKIASTEEGKKILDAWLETSFKAPCPASDGCPWNNEIEQFLDASIQEMEMISQAALENADVGVTGDEKSISTSPATPPTSVVLLNSLLETMSHAPSPSIYDSPSLHSEARAGVGLGLTEIRAPTSGMEPRAGVREEGPKEATNELDEKTKHGCAICALASQREFEDVSIMPGGSWKIVREDPTSAVVRFKAGSIEPAHHHTFGHDLIVMSGNKTVWNLTTKEKFDLKTGDFLYTPAGDLHRVAYHEDTEFFLRWDGHWDIILDEDIETARAALSASSH